VENSAYFFACTHTDYSPARYLHQTIQQVDCGKGKNNSRAREKINNIYPRKRKRP
jgi:hypothetical protein